MSAVDEDEWDSPLSREQMERLIMQVLREAGESGLSEGSLHEAIDEMERWAKSASLWRLWESGRVAVRWDPQAKDFVCWAIEGSEP